MAPLLNQIASLEVEPLEIVEKPESEQASRLATLTTVPGEVEVAALLTGKGVFPVSSADCCCCVFCCCCTCC